MEKIKIKEAKKQGLNKYFTGKPCPKGHISERYVSSRGCCECHRERNSSKEMKEYLREYLPVWGKNNKEKRRGYVRKYEENNRERARELSNKRSKERYHNDINYRAQALCRSMLQRTLKSSGITKDTRTYDLLGYSHFCLIKNIESKFLGGMTWDNYGEWNIDHYFPVSRYIEIGVTDPSIINSLENLIPMWSNHNRDKFMRTLDEFLSDNPDLVQLYGHFLNRR